ncbi:hypothetical protein BD410DRAFT_785385 [Rickenella mellea]|uniref:DUF6533 domain-containing protein n=1 Tax=Rickenella mellea TaxID=50990 RepID=A0A4Y7QAS2_9AGAM|nr:hypothetical protein BD410DRAFT_785385 [Rickenella mellea]
MNTLDLESFKQARWERNCQLAAVTVLLYEYAITFSDEVQFFWRKRWSFGKLLFLWSRYYSIAFNIGNATVFLQQHPSYDLCNRFFHWQNTGASLQVITTHVILELRLYAMYSSSKRILALFILLMACEITVMGVVFGFPKQGLVGTNNPRPGLYLCADGDPPNHVHWVSYYWTAILIIEGILLSLSLYKAYINHRTGAGGSLMKILTRDSVLYFVFIFWIYCANQIIWLANDLTLNEIGTGFSFCISAILANRLMIAVRSNFYRGHNHAGYGARDIISTVPTLDFNHNETMLTTALTTAVFRPSVHIELESFSETRGF